MAQERLQKILARAGIASRRAAEELIEQGRVTVNGKRANLGMSADAERDDIRLDAEPIRLPESFDYFMLNKPRGVISDEDVAGEHPSARDLIPASGHLYPVGRLDLGSEGLMLFTNDGALAHRLTHPRYDHPKTYEVLVEGNMPEDAIEQWRRGVLIEGKRTRPAEVRKVKRTRAGTLLEVTLREGRKRQIRKVASRLGHPVAHLVRTKLGPLALGDLPSGAWRRLTAEEVAALKEVRETPEPRRARPVARSAGGRAGYSGGPRTAPTAGGSSRRTPSSKRSRPDEERVGRREQREERPPRQRRIRGEEGAAEQGQSRPATGRAGGTQPRYRSNSEEQPGRSRPGTGRPSSRPGTSGPRRRDDADRSENRPGGRPTRSRPGSDRPGANRPARSPGSSPRPRRPSTGNKPKRGSDRP